MFIDPQNVGFVDRFRSSPIDKVLDASFVHDPQNRRAVFKELEHSLSPPEQHGEFRLQELVELQEDCFAVRLTPSIDLPNGVEHLFLDGKEKHVHPHSPLTRRDAFSLGWKLSAALFVLNFRPLTLQILLGNRAFGLT